MRNRASIDVVHDAQEKGEYKQAAQQPDHSSAKKRRTRLSSGKNTILLLVLCSMLVAYIIFFSFQGRNANLSLDTEPKEIADVKEESKNDELKESNTELKRTDHVKLLNTFWGETPFKPIPPNEAFFTTEWVGKRKEFDRDHLLGSPCEIPKPEQVSHGRDETVCSQVQFPVEVLTGKVPKECLPRLVILPSFPTSGNQIAKHLFSLTTGLSHGAVYAVEGELIHDWGEKNKFHTDSNHVCAGTFAIPSSGRVALSKTHNSAGDHVSLDHIRRGTAPSHVVRLVRNPGDNLIRNFARWSTPGHDNNKQSQKEFVRRASRSCRVALAQGTKWAVFHSGWQNAAKSVPSVVLRYEQMTALAHVSEAVQEVLEFIGEPQVFPVNYTLAVKEPAYKQGTLFRDACGLDAARRLHEITKDVEKDLGYTFNYEEGAWAVASI
mmetsp:Transcript_19603/g.28944  ORF Transcript_19603/g.28944 Transcript_19603/m.28944 type:complete len:436 (+) Transcript_19603:77-1384(+)